MVAATRTAIVGGDGRDPERWRDLGEVEVYRSPRDGGNGELRRLENALRAGSFWRVVILASFNGHAATTRVRRICASVGVEVRIVCGSGRRAVADISRSAYLSDRLSAEATIQRRLFGGPATGFTVSSGPVGGTASRADHNSPPDFSNPHNNPAEVLMSKGSGKGGGGGGSSKGGGGGGTKGCGGGTPGGVSGGGGRPSTTGKPSGGGRGNNPPGGKER